MTMDATPVRDAHIAALRAGRRRSLFVRSSLLLFLLLMLTSWIVGDFDVGNAFSARRMGNLERFLGEVRPFELGDGEWSWRVVGAWAGRLLAERGWEAALATLAISILAIGLAGAFGFVLSPLAARNFAVSHPFAPGGAQPTSAQRIVWQALRTSARALFVLLRSLPEYLLAFLLLAILGASAWPAVLALAIHNAGILGRLDAETIENVDTKPLAALRTLGARRTQIAVMGLVPAIFPRILLYFFYRWETCVREATVLGMLGVVSLGYWIQDARVRTRYDDLVFYVLLGAAIVLLGDFLSAIARRLVRQAS